MLTVLFFLIIILGLIFNKSKLVRILQYVCIFVIFVFNSWSQDDMAYRRIYSGYYGLSHEPGFDLICKICFDRGIPYETFKMVFVGVAIVLLLVALHKAFRNSSNRAYSLILLYPLLPLVELLRNLMAISIVSCGIAWYFSRERETVKNKIIYIIVILIGATFHYNVLFFLILLLTNEKPPQKSTYLQIIVISFASIIICNMPIFNRMLSLVFASEKVLSWFDTSNRIGLGVLLVMAFHIISFWTYDFIYRLNYSKVEQKEMLNGIEKISKRMYSLNVYSFALFGLYTYNMEFFSRLYIFVLLLNCFHVSAIVKKVRTKNMQIFSTMQFFYYVIMFVYFCRPFDSTGIMSFVLQNNYLIP